MILSVTEGEDKPLKYPSIFFKSELLILSKTDLLPHVPFDAELAEAERPPRASWHGGPACFLPDPRRHGSLDSLD